MSIKLLKNLLSAAVFCIVLAVPAKDVAVVFNPLAWDGKDGDGTLFNDIVSAELSCMENLKLVDREQLNKLLAERSLKPNGMLGNDDACNIGTLLGADNFVSGSVRSRNNKLMIFVKSISVRSSVVKMKYINVPADLESAAKQTAKLVTELLKHREDGVQSVSITEKLMAPDKKRPAIAVFLPEIHVANNPVIDPAAENELTKYFL